MREVNVCESELLLSRASWQGSGNGCVRKYAKHLAVVNNYLLLKVDTVYSGFLVRAFLCSDIKLREMTHYSEVTQTCNKL